MSNLNQLSSSVQNLAKQYASVIEVGKFLGTLGALETLTQETQAEHDRVAGVLVEANAQLVKVQSAIAEHAADHERNIKVSREQAEKIVADAIAQAETIENDAEQHASKVRAVAEAAQHDDENRVAGRVAELAALDAQIAQRTADLRAINEAIEAARAKFA